MSWFLRNKKKAVAAFSIALLFTPLWYLVFPIYFFIIFKTLNSRILSASNNALLILHNRQQITKIHTLVIGDTCTPEIIEQYKIGNTLEVVFPDRNMDASLQIFMHIESILEENSRLILIHDSNVTSSSLSIFDLPYLNPITIKEFKLEKLQKKAKHPILYEPVRSFKYLIGLEKRNHQQKKHPDEKLNKFCAERNIDLIYLSVN